MKVIVSPLYNAVSKLPSVHIDPCLTALNENMGRWRDIQELERDDSAKVGVIVL